MQIEVKIVKWMIWALSVKKFASLHNAMNAPDNLTA